MPTCTMPWRFAALLLLSAWPACASHPNTAKPAADPSQAEVPLPAAPGWNASLVYEGDSGIWAVGSEQFFSRLGCPEVFGLDDRGRCTILISYSGKWTPLQTVQDGQWLGALQYLDLDPHLPGKEIYAGGLRGNLYQIRPHYEVDFDTRIIARFPGQEIHTLVGGDLLPDRPGEELLGFSKLGEVWDIRPGASPGQPFEAPVIAEVGGRVRQAVVLPARDGGAPWIIGTCRSGKLLMMRMIGTGLDVHTIAEEPMGLGRLCLGPPHHFQPPVLYVTRDDGVLLRFEGTKEEETRWTQEIVYAGPQGPRGVVAGRFHEDPTVESVAVFGYSKKVQLLSRKAGEPWVVETIFEDRESGHFLAACELDGRNSTDELLASGYGKRIVLLSRPPGYGLQGVPTAPDE
ncbi:MAG: hypothetical protein V2A76_12845 [Planctomycetota bacterium]